MSDLYENIHTKQTCYIQRTETVSNPPIRVHVLSDGTRWDETQFAAHWTEIPQPHPASLETWTAQQIIDREG